MGKNYLKYFTILLGELMLMLFVFSCKKDNKTSPAPTIDNFAKLGLYEQANGNSRRVFIAVSKIGTLTQSTPYGLVFDTGSTGMTIDATDILPASMITSSGIQVAGDSVNVNGITVTNKTATISYGGVDGSIKEYGNLAYAPITIGDGNGNITTPRIPIFLYYKVVNTSTGSTLPAHSADVFGVGPGVSSTSRLIASPLSYFKLPANLTNGFRLARLSSAGFTTSLSYIASLLYIGLTPNDVSASSFIMHPLTISAGNYSPNISSTITYNGTSIAGSILFDTGTPQTNIIENNAAASNSAPLPANTTVTITTGQGFSYQYTTTSTYNLTQVERPAYSNDFRTIFSIDFFLSNEYLIDYANHRIGLKND